MKEKISYIIGSLLLIVNIAAAQVLPVVAPAQDKPVILSGGNIHTGTGEVIPGGSIAFRDGKITAVGKELSLPDIDSYTRIDVSGKEIYPGLIFLNTTLGLVEIGSVDVTVDILAKCMLQESNLSIHLHLFSCRTPAVLHNN